MAIPVDKSIRKVKYNGVEIPARRVEWTPGTASSSPTGIYAGIEELTVNDGGMSVTGTFSGLILFSGIQHIIINQPNRRTAKGMFERNQSTTRVTFNHSTAQYTDFSSFLYFSAVHTIDGVPIDFSGVVDSTKIDSDVLNFGNLVNINIAPNTIGVSTEILYKGSSNLSRASKISFINGLNANASTPDSPKTVKIGNAQTWLAGISGSVVGGLFVDDGEEITLEDFILSVKGWTIT